MILDTLKDKDFQRLSEFIHRRYGLKMPHEKKTLLQNRLKKRLQQLDMDSYEEYLSHILNTHDEAEIRKMMDVVTTHKTDFFREKEHFEFIAAAFLSNVIKYAHSDFNILSAGSSTGEEPYSVAISLLEARAQRGIYFDFSIDAFDVSEDSINKAREGIYLASKVNHVTMPVKKKYFLKHRNQEPEQVKIRPEIQNYVQFFVLNLLEGAYRLDKQYDVIFCRNTLIYFSREQKKAILGGLIDHLSPNGYLIIGHSESIAGMNLPVKLIYPTIFQKAEN